MRNRNTTRQAFSLVELLLVVAIMVILSTLLLPNLTNRRGQTEFDGTVRHMAALLREAQSKAQNGFQGTPWGVHFENQSGTPFYAPFGTAVYTTSTQVGYFALPSSVAYVTSSIAVHASSNVVFLSGTGEPRGATSIRMSLVSMPSTSATIIVASSGAVQF